jgi:hypothetical protein
MEFSQEKRHLINQRHILFCDNCYWCTTYLPDLENDTIEDFHNCPKCRQNLTRMYISEQASHRFNEKEDRDISEKEGLLVA